MNLATSKVRIGSGRAGSREVMTKTYLCRSCQSFVLQQKSLIGSGETNNTAAGSSV